MDIRNCIAELLSIHDCVIIPGFGGFIGNYAPARIDPDYHTFHPPAKHLLFNINLKQNDGLLANEVATSTGFSYTEACAVIEDFAEECRQMLKNGSAVQLPQVGQLSPGKEGIIIFEQDPNSNLLPDAFGLVPFISPPVLRTSIPAGNGLNRSGKNIVFPRMVKWAAAIALPIGIATVIGVTQFDNLSVSFADSAGIMNSVISRFSAASLVEKAEAPVMPSVAKTPVPVAAASPVPEVESPAVISSDDRFAVIVGAFRVQENAEKLVAEIQQKGMRASIFDQSRSGLFRVTVATSSNRKDAMLMLAKAKSTEFGGAWLLAK
jgi:nucleoid DNA-binding protein